MSDAKGLREAILSASLETTNFGEETMPGTLYVPPAHLKALRLDVSVVVGGRGVGKSFWTAALYFEKLRTLLGMFMPELSELEVHVGFANKEVNEFYPNADTFANFLAQGGDPYDLWRAIILRWVAKKAGQSIPDTSWSETVTWLKNQSEDAARLMQQPRSWRGLVLFDALDRTSADWQNMDCIVRGLLRAVLWLKSFSGLYAKVFLREDQSDREVFDFPDASKLLATKTELKWERHDLHGLLWQRLTNSQERNGELLRAICPAQFHKIWMLTDEMKRETKAQREAFEKIAGPYMGRDKRRGVPYTWSVNHLADGRGLTSPRSFLAAIRQAAEDSAERYPEYQYALHYESIKRGIQKASEIRVAEVAEDYPWIRNVLDELRGLNVPCDFSEIMGRWTAKFPNGVRDIPVKRLPPQHAAREWEGIREDLQRLGLLDTKKDNRIDMPDLYRVGFGLGRKGGVKSKG